ncbi:hypothetical protein L0F63_001452 [Massospora cicadina]|nr:hypothetical protein L0F63_001452 [Massospora cicadina]
MRAYLLTRYHANNFIKGEVGEKLRGSWLERRQVSEENFRVGSLLGRVEVFMLEVALRLIPTQIYLGVLPSLDRQTWGASLDKSRTRYAELRSKLIDIPREALGRLQRADHARVNPLAPDSDNPWTQYFRDGELRKVIVQDVERTFPDLDLFRDTAIQTLMTDVLFVYCKLHASNSYRQGMHELLAPMVFVLVGDATAGADAFTFSDEGKTLQAALDPEFIEHDSFALFERLMLGAGPWFEAPGPDEAARLARAHRARNQASLIRALNYPPKSSTPILALCYRVYYTHLASCDPTLFDHLEQLEIEPQLFGLRWFRLLFSREVPFPSALQLWDGILNYGSDLRLAEFVALALLLFLRDEIVGQDYATTLQRLMRPPPLHSPQILLRQAAQLAAQPDATTGYQVVTENYKIKGIHPAMLPPLPTVPTSSAQSKSKLGRNRTNSTGNIPAIAHKSSSSRPMPKSTDTPITLAQVAELDAQLITGLEQCIGWIQSEPGNLSKAAAEGLRNISSALKGRVAVLGGQPFKGDPLFGFPSSTLASVLNKDEPWEFIAKPDPERPNEQAPASKQPKPHNDHTPPGVEPPKVHPKVNHSLQKAIPNEISAKHETEKREPEPQDPEHQNEPGFEQQGTKRQEAERKDHSKAVPSDSPAAQEASEIKGKPRSASEPPTPPPISNPKPQANSAVSASIPQFITSPIEESSPQSGQGLKPPLSPTKSPNVKLDNRKLKQVREQYDWIFGSSDQDKPQRFKITKNVSDSNEKRLPFTSSDPLGAASNLGNGEGFLSTLRAPLKLSSKKSPSLASLSCPHENLGEKANDLDLQDQPPMNPSLHPNLSKADGWSTSLPNAQPSPPIAPLDSGNLIEIFTSQPAGLELTEPLFTPSCPPDDFVNPW